jgi:hypothetical protein
MRAAACHGADMIPVWQNHAELCVQIQISNRFCGHDDVVRYLSAVFLGECTDQQIYNNFSF